MIPTDTNGIFWLLVSLRSVNTMKGIFEQLSELLVAKCIMVHVLSSSSNVSSFELPNKKQATQQWSLHAANDIVLNQVRSANAALVSLIVE